MLTVVIIEACLIIRCCTPAGVPSASSRPKAFIKAASLLALPFPDRHQGHGIMAVLPKPSLQLRILGFGFLQDVYIGVGVFPEGEKISVRALRLRLVPTHRIGATEFETG